MKAAYLTPYLAIKRIESLNAVAYQLNGSHHGDEHIWHNGNEKK